MEGRKMNRIVGLACVLGLMSLASRAQPLAGTQRLTVEGDFAEQMVDGIDRILLRETAASIDQRARWWKRDTSSVERYVESVQPNRARFAMILGVVDTREKFDAPELMSTTQHPALVGRGDGFEAYAVRWPVIG